MRSVIVDGGRAMRTLWPVVLMLLGPKGAIAQSLGPLEPYLQVTGSLTLEESDSVVTVTPVVAIDPDGGFIVADVREAQVRLYDRRGRLRSLVATRGSGPGEVRSPISAIREADGQILVADFGGGNLLELTNDGEELERYGMPFPVVQVLARGTRTYLVGIPRRTGENPAPRLLHEWAGGDVVRSFFPTPFSPAMAGLEANYSTATAASDENGLLAAYALTDTLFVYSDAGELLERVSLGLKYWSLPTADPPGGATSRERQRWLEGLTRIANVYRVGNRFLVQYAGVRGVEIVWHLACLSRDGQRIFDEHDTPRLLAVDDDVMIFVDATSMTEEKWVFATFR